jgi:hypothetical protein
MLSFMAVGYGLFILKKKIDSLDLTKKDLDEEDIVEDGVYQAWSGAFADGENSLLITLVRQKVCTKKANTTWIDWDGTEDSSVINRNFYLGNSDPSFSWTIETRESDTKAIVKETLTDGWNSVIQIKLEAFVKEFQSDTNMNHYLKKLVEEGRIEWQKTLITKREFREEFN